MPAGKLLLYLLRRDLRVADNPIFHNLSTEGGHGFDTLLPVYVFPRKQMETSGFLREGSTSPYPPAVSQVGKFWRCGPHRAKFIAQAVWDLKGSLEALRSGLAIHVGDHARVVEQFIRHFKDTDTPVGAVWMTEEVSAEEMDEQESVAAACAAAGVDFKLWADEKYFVDDRDTGLASSEDLPDVFTTYRKTQEPLRERPRETVNVEGKLPYWPGTSTLPPQLEPFVAAASVEDSIARLCKPLKYNIDFEPTMPQDTESAHPFQGGERPAMERVTYLLESGAMSKYSDTRNGLLGADFSTKLSAYLALGCISARQVHAKMLAFEDGTDDAFSKTKGYGEGENEGTKAVRFELLWRDYMRLCTKKFKNRLFSVSGFRQDDGASKKWKTTDDSRSGADNAKEGGHSADDLQRILKRFFAGTTGMGLIDASLRELYLTGYTSNRARQNVASFFAKHLLIDWRYGAEWYESLLIDYDVSSNWANWQYVAGVGNDPRGDARIFNPVKQAFDYDKHGLYVRAWVPEVKDLEKVENVFQPWTTTAEDLKKYGLADSILVTDPLKRIEFTVERKPRSNRRPYSRGRGRGGGGRGGTPAQQAPGYGNGPMPMAPPAMMPMGAQHLYPPVGYDAAQAYVWPNQPVMPPWTGAPPGAHPPMAQSPMGQPPMGQPAGWNNGQVWYRDNSMPPSQGEMGNMGVYHGRGGFNYRHQPPPQ